MFNQRISPLISGVMLTCSFCLSASAATKADEGIEWPPYSDALTSGPRAGFFPHTDKYVTLLGAPQFLKKGMFYFSIPQIWYEKQDGSTLMEEGKLLKRAKDKFVGGRVCDAVALGVDLREGNYSWQCVDEMIGTDKFYFRKDDPVLTGAKIKPEKSTPINPKLAAILEP